MKTVLLTGASGFVGANLFNALVESNNYSVHILLREQSNTWRIKDKLGHKRVTIHYHDLMDYDSLCKIVREVNPDHIFHLATYGAYPTAQKDITTMLNTNIHGTINLINACNTIDYECFINTGSSSEYGKKSSAMSETDIPEPSDLYGITKVTTQLYCSMIAKQTGKPIIHIRLFSVYGPYEESIRLVPSLCLSIVRDAPVFNITSGTQTRDFIYVEDVIDAYFCIASNAKKLAGKTINIGTGVKTTIKDFTKMTIDISESSIQLNIGSLPTRDNETFNWVSDTAIMKELLNWEPKHSIKDGITKTLEWYNKNHSLYI